MFSDLDPIIFKVDDKDMNAIKVLYENCKIFSKVENIDSISYNADRWFKEVVQPVLESVDYISKAPSFTYFNYSEGEMYAINLSCKESLTFKKIDDLIDFLKSEKFYEIVVYYIRCNVNLDKMEKTWNIVFGKIEETQIKRDKKIEHLERWN